MTHEVKNKQFSFENEMQNMFILDFLMNTMDEAEHNGTNEHVSNDLSSQNRAIFS